MKTGLPCLLIFICLAFCLPTLAQAEKPKSKLLDGELIEHGQPAPAPPPVQAAPADHATQTVTLLQDFTVTLPATPSTGFSWRVVSYDRQFLELLRTRMERPAQPRPGAPGRQCFDFRSRRSGQTTITFHYQRPWEKAVARQAQRTILIK